MTGFADNIAPQKEVDPETIRRNIDRMDRYIQAALTGCLANPAWNSQEAQAYLRAKKLTLEQISVAAGMETMVQMDKFMKGERGGDDEFKPEIVK